MNFILEILHVGWRSKLALKQHKHFHPSGDPEPSKADIDITQKLFDVCQLMEVEFCDHIIIGGDNYFSFREDYSHEQKKKREAKKKEE